MSSWHEFTQQAPEFAKFGQSRFTSGVAYLGTIRPDGGPRVHPVTPIIGEELFLFMEPTSPKGNDLRRGSHFALHAAVEDNEGGAGEFFVTGTGRFLPDPADRAVATAQSQYAPADRYILFELLVDFAMSNVYQADGPPLRLRWRREEP